jgi:hypothetical protein
MTTDNTPETMTVSLDGLRINVARSFNKLAAAVIYSDRAWSDAEDDEREAWHELRMHIAFLLLVYHEDPSIGFSQLDPDELLVDFPEEEQDVTNQLH